MSSLAKTKLWNIFLVQPESDHKTHVSYPSPHPLPPKNKIRSKVYIKCNLLLSVSLSERASFTWKSSNGPLRMILENNTKSQGSDVTTDLNVFFGYHIPHLKKASGDIILCRLCDHWQVICQHVSQGHTPAVTTPPPPPLLLYWYTKASFVRSLICCPVWWTLFLLSIDLISWKVISVKGWNNLEQLSVIYIYSYVIKLTIYK